MCFTRFECSVRAWSGGRCMWLRVVNGFRLLRSLLLTIPACTCFTGAMIFVSYVVRSTNLDLQNRLFKLWARGILLICGVQTRIAGIDHIDKSRQYLFVCNHSSLMDGPVLIASM